MPPTQTNKHPPRASVSRLCVSPQVLICSARRSTNTQHLPQAAKAPHSSRRRSPRALRHPKSQHPDPACSPLLSSNGIAKKNQTSDAASSRVSPSRSTCAIAIPHRPINTERSPLKVVVLPWDLPTLPNRVEIGSSGSRSSFSAVAGNTQSSLNERQLCEKVQGGACGSRVAGRWSLVAGRWSLVAGRWSLDAASRVPPLLRCSVAPSRRFRQWCAFLSFSLFTFAGSRPAMGES